MAEFRLLLKQLLLVLSDLVLDLLAKDLLLQKLLLFLLLLSDRGLLACFNRGGLSWLRLDSLNRRQIWLDLLLTGLIS